MKLKDEPYLTELTQQVDYFGIKLIVPVKYTHIATDENGTIYAFDRKPDICNTFFNPTHCDYIMIAFIALGDTNWYDSLKLIEDIKYD